MTPVAFGLVYSLSGAVGPILAQNLGARHFQRVRDGLRASLLFMIFAVAAAWLVLALAQGLIVRAFSAEGDAAALIHVYCSWIASGFFFVGALFVAKRGVQQPRPATAVDGLQLGPRPRLAPFRSRGGGSRYGRPAYSPARRWAR